MAYESAAARIADQLRTEILHGDLAPGTKLAQVGLAERFGVSRIPVRDALAILAGEGLVQPLANATAVVTSMSVEELQELYELREAIEPMATADRAAERRPRRHPLHAQAVGDDGRMPPTPARGWRPTPSSTPPSTGGPTAPRTIELIEQLRRLDRPLHLPAPGGDRPDRPSGRRARGRSWPPSKAETDRSTAPPDPRAPGGRPRPHPDLSARTPFRHRCSHGGVAMTDRALIRQAMAQLTPPHRDMIYRAHYLGRSITQIAAELGTSERVVRAELHDAMRGPAPHSVMCTSPSESELLRTDLSSFFNAASSCARTDCARSSSS